MTQSGDSKSAQVILVHGAWADGSSWTKVILALRHAGISVVAAPIPLTSLDDDVAALVRVIDRTDGPVLLVGHAYAGAVIGAAAHARVRGLVYIAALAPDDGETIADMFYREPPQGETPELAPGADGYIWLPHDAFASAFAQHASSDEQAVLAATQRPIHVSCIQKPVLRPQWHTCPTWYLVAGNDRMINPSTQAFMAERMNARQYRHPTDHAPLITEPGIVVDVIRGAAESIARQADSGNG